MSEVKFKSFKEFYPYYLSEHKLTINKLLHVIGSLSGLCFLFYCIIQKFYSYIPISFIFGYSFAWVGHFVFEKNRPATFKYLLYSLRGDFAMFWHIIIGKVKIF